MFRLVMQDYEILNNFIIENSTKLQKLVWEGEISWVMSSHFNQEHMPHQFLIIHEHGKIQKKGTMARRFFQLLWFFGGHKTQSNVHTHTPPFKLAI